MMILVTSFLWLNFFAKLIVPELGPIYSWFNMHAY